MKGDHFFFPLPPSLEGYAKQQWLAVGTLSRDEHCPAVLGDIDTDNSPVVREAFHHTPRKEIWVELGSGMMAVHCFPIFPVLPIKVWVILAFMGFRRDWREQGRAIGAQDWPHQVVVRSIRELRPYRFQQLPPQRDSGRGICVSVSTPGEYHKNSGHTEQAGGRDWTINTPFP